MAVNIPQLAAAMRRAVKRKADESDSEDSFDIVTNRGNKLKKKAKYIREGQLAPPSGPEVYKEAIEHAGFKREIISRRPVVYDNDGFEIDTEDEDEEHQELIAAANELYPYANIRIEDLLAPLTRPADLPDHPTLSLAFTSKPLTELARNAQEMVQKEKASLWRMKQLLSRLSGDQPWVPTDLMETSDDIVLFNLGHGGYREHVQEKQRLNIEAIGEDLTLKAIAVAGSALDESVEILPAAEVAGANPDIKKASPNIQSEDNVHLIDASTGEASAVTPTVLETEDGEKPEPGARPDDDDPMEGVLNEEANRTITTVTAKPRDQDQDQDQDLAAVVENPTRAPEETSTTPPEDAVAADDKEEPAPRRMRTRAQAQAASDENTASRNRSTTPDSNASYIHPYFLAPPSARPDRDIGLPAQEAEDTRRLLQLYIQKQEEVCRGAQKLYDGLLNVDRMRKTVLKWTKADAHLGELSDGEDWYDKDEWGLSEDLKKGQDEEEEDAATTAKKTRTRRA